MRFHLTALTAFATTAAVTASWEPIATYAPGSDVTEHNSLDLDMQAILEALSLQTDEGFQNASSIYSDGGYSLDTSDPIRSYQGFSLQAKEKMWEDCPGCPYLDYSYFYNYYGSHTYGDDIVTAALEGSITSLAKGNFDMSGVSFVGREEVAKKGMVVLNNFMYTIREFEDALDDCQSDCVSCNDGSVHAWDEGVAFYTGSLEGADGSGEGVLLYALADKRCVDYHTCSASGNGLDGTSKVNHELFQLFSLGNYQLLTGDCPAARKTKDRVAQLMYIPLVQGALRYAYKMEFLQGGEKENAEGAIFAAGVVPKVAHFNQGAADTIYSNLKMGTRNTNYAATKKAFENVYPQMGITCADVGGLYSEEIGSYYPGAEPCKDTSNSNKAAVIGGAIGGILGVAIVGLVVFIVFIRHKEVSGEPYFVAKAIEAA